MIEKRTMTGAQVDHKLARTSVQYRGAKTQWIWHAEWVEVQRGLGIMMNSYNSLGSQTDRAVRTMVETNTSISKKWKATHRLGWIRDFMDYRDGNTVIGVPQPQVSIAVTTHLQTEWYYRPSPKTLLLLGGDFQSQQADISHYLMPVNRTLPAVFVAWHKIGDAHLLSRIWSWQRVATARFEAKERIPTASISWVVKPLTSVAQVKFNIHSTFRRPTLNDLYWYIPGNRPTLTYEQGAGTELAWQRKWTKHGSLEWLVYGRYLDKPIIWVPAGAFWMPVNLQGGGLYYGGQSKTKAYLYMHPKRGNIIWINQWERSISWVKSNPQATAYHQIFIPNLAGRSSLLWQKQLFTAELAYAYTGKRFIQTDNKEYLPGFGLVQAEINYQKTIHNKVVLFRLEGDNLLNIQYQTVPNRPMPGASVRFTTTFRF
jgi:hypothetical protein